MAVKRGLLSDTDSLFVAKLDREFAVGLPDPRYPQNICDQ